MNAKKLLLLFLCIVSLSGICETTDPPTNGADRIVLRGSLDLNYNPNDVEAYVDQNYVYIYFHQNFGNVSITLYNETGVTVYSDVVNTAVQQTVIIPISGFTDTTYVLVLENANGYAEGEFDNSPN